MRSVSIPAILIIPLAAVAAAPAQEPAAPLSSPSPPAAPPQMRCAPPRVAFAGAGPAAARARTLGEEPAASHYLAVDRRVGGCPEPAVVRTGIR